MIFLKPSTAKSQFKLNNCSRAVQMLNAAKSIDPGNHKMFQMIINVRDHFVKDLIARLEREIESEFPDRYKEVEKLIVSNQLYKAEKLVEEIYNEEPKVPQAYYLKGLALYMTGSLKEAQKQFDLALEIDDTMECAIKMNRNAKRLHDLIDEASQEMEKKNYTKVIELLTTALATDKDNRVINQAAHFQRALAYYNAGDLPNAFEDYKKFELMSKLCGDILKGIEMPKNDVVGKKEGELDDSQTDVADDKNSTEKKDKKKEQIVDLIDITDEDHSDTESDLISQNEIIDDEAKHDEDETESGSVDPMEQLFENLEQQKKTEDDEIVAEVATKNSDVLVSISDIEMPEDLTADERMLSDNEPNDQDVKTERSNESGRILADDIQNTSHNDERIINYAVDAVKEEFHFADPVVTILSDVIIIPKEENSTSHIDDEEIKKVDELIDENISKLFL